eukprot:TRINITY_DN37206_c0_g1_i1.p1 TRINITY_DN37206_c0_g1~~TRINITY_DN37206_c0_g1_i1.p1  ORF type:complete len:259 (-),score=61.97 TRINITY_DN37206_c0_g1_i1:106-786(-)
MNMNGGWVPRSEYQALEKRLQRAEMAIVNQEQQLCSLGQQLMIAGLASASGMMGGGSGARDRSRTPSSWFGGMGGGEKPTLPQPQGEVVSVEEFAIQNSLDQKCIENLRAQPLEVQKFVIAQGLVDGKNPSAMVMSRIARCMKDYQISSGSSDDIKSKVEEFIIANGLDENVAEALRTQNEQSQVAILSQGPADGRNPSAMIQGRIAKLKLARWRDRQVDALGYAA